MTNGNFGSRGLSRDPKSLEVSASDRVKVDPTQMIGTIRCSMSASPPEADIAAGRSESPLCAMCGRLRVGKAFLHVCRLVGAAMCSACLCGSHDRWPQFNSGRGLQYLAHVPPPMSPH